MISFGKKQLVWILIIILVVGCSNSTPNNVEVESIETNTPVPTPIPPTDLPPEEKTLTLPLGEAPVIDGVLTDGEWEQAVVTKMSDGAELYWLYVGEEFYLGVRSTELGAVNLSIQDGERVRILHSSAALGSAFFERGEEAWDLIQNYDWCCRSTTNFDEMNDLFAVEGWTASIGYLGIPSEVEFKVTIPEGETLVAVSFMFADSSVAYWPEDLSEAAVEQIKGYLPEQEQFLLEEWVSLDFGN